MTQSSATQRVLFGLILSCFLAVALASGVRGQGLQGQLDATRGELESERKRKGVLSGEIERFSSRISQLSGEVATLRNREAEVEAELARTEERLADEKDRLIGLKERLARSLDVLGDRLVEIYKSDQPDALTVILESDGFDDLVNRYDYLDRIQDQDASIVGRVRDLRDESRETVERVEADRDFIAAKEAELERTRVQLEAREAKLNVARDAKTAALGEVEDSIQRLEGDMSDLSAEIEKRLQSQASTTTSDPLPAGPVQGAGSGDFIWPVDATLTSPFGPRWGRLHAGLDLAAPGGTPIWATKDGRVTMAEYYGGYGNYTCVDHGGGVSSCYAHQSRFGTLTGASVKQGEVIGYVGTTGSSTGDHLHFEIRVNGTPVDPMGYLD